MSPSFHGEVSGIVYVVLRPTFEMDQKMFLRKDEGRQSDPFLSGRTVRS